MEVIQLTALLRGPPEEDAAQRVRDSSPSKATTRAQANDLVGDRRRLRRA